MQRPLETESAPVTAKTRHQTRIATPNNNPIVMSSISFFLLPPIFKLTKQWRPVLFCNPFLVCPRMRNCATKVSRPALDDVRALISQFCCRVSLAGIVVPPHGFKLRYKCSNLSRIACSMAARSSSGICSFWTNPRAPAFNISSRA